MIVTKKMRRWRSTKDIIRQVFTYLFSSIGILILAGIIVFIFSNGVGLLSWDLLTSDYASQTFVVSSSENVSTGQFELPLEYQERENPVYFSSRWGVGFSDEVNNEGGDIVQITYLDAESPFLHMINQGNDTSFELTTEMNVTLITYFNDQGFQSTVFAKDNAKIMAAGLEDALSIKNLNAVVEGGGIRGSLLSTIYMILMTLLIALPLGIGSAIYLSEFAPQNKFTNLITAMIDMSAGIPSIIFGFVGAIIFVPLFNGGKYSLMAGCLTLVIMLLPTIIRTTTEALQAVPQDLRNGSLALGASEVQTTFKVVLPNAVGGILTSVLLAIGRIIGESAALILTIGTAVNDAPGLGKSGTTLAVHIWSVMGGETPNVALASAISIIILATVLILSILTKLVAKKLNKWGD